MPKVAKAALGTILMIFLAACQSPQSSETAWPDFQPKLRPSESTSPVKASLLEDVSVAASGNNVVPERQAYQGIWHGWMCRDRVGDTKLAVEAVDNEAATIVYAFASSRVPPYVERLKAYFRGDELHGRLGGGARIFYRLRADGHMDVMWRGSADDWCSGILSKME